MKYSVPGRLDIEGEKLSPQALKTHSKDILDSFRSVEDKLARWGDSAQDLTGENFDAALAEGLLDEILTEIRTWSNSEGEPRVWEETLEAARAELITSPENALDMIYQTTRSIDSYLRDPQGIAAHVFRESHKLASGQHLYRGSLINNEAENIAKLSDEEAELQDAACGTLNLEAKTGLSSVSLIDNPRDLQRRVADIKTDIDRAGTGGNGTRIESDREEFDRIGRRLQDLVARFDTLLRNASTYTWRELSYKTVDDLHPDPSYFNELLGHELSENDLSDFVENLRTCFREFETHQQQIKDCLNRLDFHASEIRDALQIHRKELKTLSDRLCRLELEYSLPSPE